MEFKPKVSVGSALLIGHSDKGGQCRHAYGQRNQRTVHQVSGRGQQGDLQEGLSHQPEDGAVFA